MDDALSLNRALQTAIRSRLVSIRYELAFFCALQTLLPDRKDCKIPLTADSTPVSAFIARPFDGYDSARARKGSWTREEQQHLLFLVNSFTKYTRQFEASQWLAVASELFQETATSFSSLECFQEYMRLVSATSAFSKAEDCLIHDLSMSVGYKWVSISESIQETLGVLRCPFHVAERYRVRRGVMHQESNLKKAKVWEYVRPFTNLEESHVDTLRLSVLVNERGRGNRLPITPLSIESALQVGYTNRLLQSSFSETYWRVYGTLCFLVIPLRRKVPSFFAESALRYAQLSLPDMAASLQCSGQDLVHYISKKLLCSKDCAAVNCRTVSIELFGHDRASLIVFQVSEQMK